MKKLLKLLIIIGFLIPMSMQAQDITPLVGINSYWNTYNGYVQTYRDDYASVGDDDAISRFSVAGAAGIGYKIVDKTYIRTMLSYRQLLRAGTVTRSQITMDVAFLLDLSPMWGSEGDIKIYLLAGGVWVHTLKMDNFHLRGNVLGPMVGMQIVFVEPQLGAEFGYFKGTNRHGDQNDLMGLSIFYVVNRNFLVKPRHASW